MSTGTQAETTAAPAQAKEFTLDDIVKATRPIDTNQAARNKDYVGQFLAQVVKPGQVVSKDVETNIKYWIGEIDKKLSAQLNEVMHHPDFQRLEGTWRGMHYLVHQSETGTELKIRVLNCSKRELLKDLQRASEFDQSALFKKVHEAEFGMLGGQPYGLLVGDYEFSKHPEDIELLGKISEVAAASHAPFVAAAAPKMFGFDTFTELSKPRDLAKIFDSVEYAGWKAFRESENSRYVALTMPHVLARLPYGEAFKKVTDFNFEETVDGREHDKYLWMNAAWAYAARVTDAFAKCGWLAQTRGVEGGGRVEGLPVHTFPTDEGDVAMKCPTEIAIADRREFELSNLGFLPLLHCKNENWAVFMGAQSCQKPQAYYEADANANAELSAKFNLIMCVARFAHYVKMLARFKIGSNMEPKDCENWLNKWIKNYVVANPESLGPELRAKKPLRDARIEVRENKAKPGWYEAVAYLRPHFQLEKLDVSLRLVANVPPPKK